MALIEASCWIGWLNWRTYCSIACTSPIEIAPLAMRSPPITAIDTNCRLPMKPINGWMRLDENWAERLASYIRSFSSSKSSQTSS